jgi:hypothetical protein
MQSISEGINKFAAQSNEDRFLDQDIGRFLGLAMFEIGNQIESQAEKLDDNRILSKFKTGMQLSTFVELKYGKLEVKISEWKSSVLDKLKNGSGKPYKLKPIKVSEFAERQSAKQSLKERNRNESDIQTENDMTDYTLDESGDRELSAEKVLDSSPKWSANLKALNLNQTSISQIKSSRYVETKKNKFGMANKVKPERDFSDIIKKLKLDKDRINDRINKGTVAPSITLFPTQPKNKGKYGHQKSNFNLDSSQLERDKIGIAFNNRKNGLPRNRIEYLDSLELSKGQSGTELLRAGSQIGSRRSSFQIGFNEQDGLKVGGVGFKSDDNEPSIKQGLKPYHSSNQEDLGSILKKTDPRYHLGLLLRDLVLQTTKGVPEPGKGSQEQAFTGEQARGAKERKVLGFGERLVKDSGLGGQYKGQYDSLVQELLNNQNSFLTKKLITVDKVMGKEYDRQSVIQNALASLSGRGMVARENEGKDINFNIQEEIRIQEEAALRMKQLKQRIGTPLY